MTSTNPLNFPSPDPSGVSRITIDRNGDTFLTLDDPKASVLDQSPPPNTYIFLVSSQMLQTESHHFRALFSRTWQNRELREDKYYIRLQSLPATALYMLLLAQHNPIRYNPEEDSYGPGP